MMAVRNNGISSVKQGISPVVPTPLARLRAAIEFGGLEPLSAEQLP